jgi:hypothetical protein
MVRAEERTMRTLRNVIVAAFVLWTGCGGDDDGPPAVDANLGDTRVLSSLSDGDYIALCQARFASITPELAQGIARYACLQNTGQACNQAEVDDCVDLFLTIIDEAVCAAPASDDPMRSCSGTVQELLDCIAEQVVLILPSQDDTCTDYPVLPITMPASCQSLEQRCPGLDV